MAASSRASRRFAYGSLDGRGQVPTVDTTSPTTRLGKRTLSAGDGRVPSVKKQKLEEPDLSRSKAAARVHFSKAFASTPPARAVTRPIASLRITSAVQPPATGTIIANGILQPPNGDAHASKPLVNGTSGESPKESEKRALRSQDGGSRSKSELSLYFPNYEELISTEPKQSGEWIRLTSDTVCGG
jgi:hypothetical protein